PFLVNDWNAFYDDVVRYNAGGAAWTYPISGMGFSAILLWLGVIGYRQADFPFAVIEIAVAAPIALYTLYQLWRMPSIARMLGGYALTLLAFLFFGRYFQGNYLGYILAVAPERASLLEHAGAQDVIVFTFDKAFSQQSAEEFIKRVTAAGDVQRIVVGPDFQFGHGREGAVPALRTLGECYAFAVMVVEPIALGGAVISSTRIRQALREGDLVTAQA